MGSVEEDGNELEEELTSISRQITDLQIRQKKLMLECDKKFLKEARSNIGRCFYNPDKNIYAKIIDVPQFQWTASGYNLNRYQYPAIFIGENEDDKDSAVPFYTDTIFSGVWGIGYEVLQTYKEITKEEFEEQFANALKLFEERILSI